MKITLEAPAGESACLDLQERIQRALTLRVPVELAAAGSLPRYEMKAKRWIRRGVDI
jgi:phenylacetate-coenzyme A ligase PaaK-like adenylate-forming protein